MSHLPRKQRFFLIRIIFFPLCWLYHGLQSSLVNFESTKVLYNCISFNMYFQNILSLWLNRQVVFVMDLWSYLTQCSNFLTPLLFYFPHTQILSDIFFCIFPYHARRLLGSDFPGYRLNRDTWQWKRRVLTTGPPRNSPEWYSLYSETLFDFSHRDPGKSQRIFHLVKILFDILSFMGGFVKSQEMPNLP